jgi:poly(ADP-ribose) glycohydrolase ARH3
MTKTVAKCLLDYDSSYQKSLTVNFVKEYFNSPSRGYGSGTKELFQQLRKSKFEDIHAPANQQFNGNGSFGNGAAMRVSPVALYCVNKPEEFLIDLVKKTSEVTHSNVIGLNGAILQAFAIVQNLKKKAGAELNADEYLTELLEKFKTVEKGEDE